QKHGYKFPIESRVVFVHPEFALYQLNSQLPIVLPNQIRRFIYKINNTHSKLTPTHRKLADTIFSLQTSRTPSARIPNYELDGLKKGIPCLKCDGFLVPGGVHGKKLVCNHCDIAEGRESAVLRNIEEFKMLFPERKITTAAIWEWSGKIISKFKIRKILFQFLEPVGARTDKHFLSPFKDRY